MEVKEKIEKYLGMNEIKDMAIIICAAQQK